MRKIDTTNWGDFRVGDLFDFERGKVKKLQILPEGPTPVVAAARSCQGVAGYYEADAPYCNQITISCNGVGCGSSFYHNYPFNVNGDAIVLKEKVEIPEKAKIFISCMLDGVLFRKYSYEEKCSPQKVSDEIIKLPITADNKPDWQHMERYMQQKEDGARNNISLLYNIVGKPRTKIDTTTWKRFHLYDDTLFTIDSGTKLDKVKMTDNNPSINFVGRANANNGVTDFIDEIEGLTPYEAGNLTISLGGEYLGSCFIQEKPFYTSQNVNVLIPKHIMSDHCKRFISIMVFKEGRLRYKAFIDELNRHMRTDFSVLLPVTSTGTPDWDYMEQYMESIERKTQTILSFLTI